MKEIIFLGYDVYFWISVVAASIVKFILGETHTVRHAFLTGFVGIWFAWTFTIPIVDFTGWESETYNVGVAGTLALTGNGLAKTLISITSDPKSLGEFLSGLLKRGGKS